MSPSIRPQEELDCMKVAFEEPIFRRPDVNLLDPKQWCYIQRRYHISPRELEIAELVCRGFTNGEIAETLRIKRATVKTHLRNIYRRIHVASKIQMLLKFVEQAHKSEYNSRSRALSCPYPTPTHHTTSP